MSHMCLLSLLNVLVLLGCFVFFHIFSWLLLAIALHWLHRVSCQFYRSFPCRILSYSYFDKIDKYLDIVPAGLRFINLTWLRKIFSFNFEEILLSLFVLNYQTFFSLECQIYELGYLFTYYNLNFSINLSSTSSLTQ